jgi:uncharacterized protein with NRDE domain
MCTVTIHRTDSNLLVTMNRDEARFRAPEIPAREQIGRGKGVKWLAPIDGQAGGTWFGVNEYGVHACLLNRYLPDDTLIYDLSGERPSRGRIIIELLELGHEHDALQWLNTAFDPKRYPSFWLILAGPHETRSFAWDGHVLERQTFVEPWLLFSSSSWRTHDVIEYRKQAFETWVNEGEHRDGLIPSFHLLQPTDRAEWAPFMDRQYSATRSITQTQTDFIKQETEMRYWPREHLHNSAAPFTRLKLNHAHAAQTS